MPFCTLLTRTEIIMEDDMLRGLALWLLGIPIPIIILLLLFLN